MKLLLTIAIIINTVQLVAAKNEVAPKKETTKEVKKDAKSKHPVKKAAPIASPNLGTDWRAPFEEAKNLLIPNQKYVLRYEDEELVAKPTQNGALSVSTVFTPQEVNEYQSAVQAIYNYAQGLRRDCSTLSSRTFFDGLSRYAKSLSAFHKKALPLVGDISENNNIMVLIVNRTTLKDAAVLSSRYLQYKKQRFKENMNDFLQTDTNLVSSLTKIAKILKVELTEDDWNKAYGMREQSLEMISQWPRKMIFDATSELSDVREKVCKVVVVDNSKNTPAVAPEKPAE